MNTRTHSLYIGCVCLFFVGRCSPQNANTTVEAKLICPVQILCKNSLWLWVSVRCHKFYSCASEKPSHASQITQIFRWRARKVKHSANINTAAHTHRHTHTLTHTHALALLRLDDLQLPTFVSESSAANCHNEAAAAAAVWCFQEISPAMATLEPHTHTHTYTECICTYLVVLWPG